MPHRLTSIQPIQIPFPTNEREAARGAVRAREKKIVACRIRLTDSQCLAAGDFIFISISGEGSLAV